VNLNIINLAVRMSEEISTLEESAKEVLVDLRTEKVMLERRMSAGVQASLTGGVQAFPLTAHVN
jgi:hypothetical protein